MNKKMFQPQLDFRTLRTANVIRCEDVFHKLKDWSPTDWATAMAGECGEACNFVKKLRRLDGADETLDTADKRLELHNKVAKELADLVIYADLLAARMNIDLGAAIAVKFNEVSERRGSKIKLNAELEEPVVAEITGETGLEQIEGTTGWFSPTTLDEQ